MHSIQQDSLKTQTNQHESTTRSIFCLKCYSTMTPLALHFPQKDKQITTYADEITITTSHIKHRKAKQLIQHVFTKSMNGPLLLIFI